MKRLSLIIFLISAITGLKGQEGTQNLIGKVSFISSQNTYVRFKSTDGISVGDTLFISSEGRLIPVLKVTGLSSVSCVGTAVSDISLPQDHLIIAIKRSVKEEPQKVIVQNLPPDTIPVMKSDSSTTGIAGENKSKQEIKGSLSAISYSDFSDTGMPDSYRFRYTLSLDAKSIAGSKFSAETYISFRHKAGEWDTIKKDIFSALKIYNLAVRYDLNSTTRFSIGRKINQRIASIGAMDGVQAEKSFGKFTMGAVAGFRPDYADYGFNPSLLQYGAYLGFDTRNTTSYTGNTIAFMQQMNNSATDRRFLYFQHSSSLLKNVNLLSTFEIDLYKLENDQPKSTFDLTSLYLSMRYRITRKLSVSGSYDSRKNIMYYETYKSYLDRILEDERRQGFRLQASYLITENIILGVNPGYRFLKSDPHPSKNIYGYLTLRQIPGLKMFTSTITGTYIETAYINGWIGGINLSGSILKGKLQPGLGYRYVDYSLPENGISIIQNIAELNIALNIIRTLFFSLNYEGTFEPSAKYNRVYLQLRQRF